MSGLRPDERTEVPAPAGRWRLLCVIGCVLALTLGVAVRVVMLQGAEERAFLKQQGDARTVRTVALRASRGVIYDRRGEPLAVSTPVSSVWANPQRVDADDADLARLAGLLGLSAKELHRRLDAAGGREFVYLRRQMDPAVAQRIADLDIPGIELEEEFKRFYPAGEVASHVVGITDIDDKGIEGVELSFDDWLAGSAGRKRVIRDRRGHVVRDLEYLKSPEPGHDLTLSIDMRLQYLAYRELKAAMTQYAAQSATMIVLDVHTGEVLAMVNQPGYNPNAPVPADRDGLRNRAVTDVYEPGSTVKPLTVSAALESGRFAPDAIVDTSPGWVRVGDKVIRDPINRGPLSLGQIIAKSSQVGISHIALKLDDQMLRDVFTRFGFGAVTGIGYPGESSGRMPMGHDWPVIQRVTLAYGYGLSVTPLQLVQAYTVFASGGSLHRPTLLRVDADDPAPAARPVLSPVIASEVSTMLEGVVQTDGTAAKAAIPGYRVAGKTGTVRKIGPDGYDGNHHIGYFVGFAPASDPRVAAVVVINDPDVAHSGGGAVAAPVFARVVSGAMRLLNVPPDLDASGHPLSRSVAAAEAGAGGAAG